MHPDEAGAAQLGCAAREDGVELALVVVVALRVVVVDAANIADDVAGLEHVGITGADEGAVTVLGEKAEQVDGQSLVGVEVAVVGANDGRVGHLDAFGVWLGHMSADDGVEGDWGGDARMGEGKSLLFGQDGS